MSVVRQQKGGNLRTKCPWFGRDLLNIYGEAVNRKGFTRDLLKLMFMVC